MTTLPVQRSDHTARSCSARRRRPVETRRPCRRKNRRCKVMKVYCLLDHVRWVDEVVRACENTLVGGVCIKRHHYYKMYYLCVVSADGKSFGAGQRPQLPIFLPAGISGRGRTARPLRQGCHDAPRQALGRQGHGGRAPYIKPWKTVLTKRAGDRGRILSSRCPWRASRWHCNLVLHDPVAGSFGIFSAFFRLPY